MDRTGHRARKGQRRAAGIALSAAIAAMVAVGPAAAQDEPREAPFGDKVSQRIPFYHRAAPQVATSGPLGRLGMIEAKAVGFRTVVSLRPKADEGGNLETMARFTKIRFVALPVEGALPSEAQLKRLAAILGETPARPVLIYGRDRDQAAAAWALLRAMEGVPARIAYQEGLTAGLRGRAGAVRERLGLSKQD